MIWRYILMMGFLLFPIGARAACTVVVTPTGGGTVTVTGSTTSGGCAPDSTPVDGGVEVGSGNPLHTTLSGTTVPLPSGAATAANQVVPTAAGTSGANAMSIQGIAGGVAQAISASALPLPSGAATAANQANTVPGTSATTAQGVQGVTGGVVLGVADATVVAAVNAAALPNPLPTTGNTATDGSTTVTTGGTAQNLFGGTTPTNGYLVCNPNTTDDLWVSDSTTAAANGTGSYRVAANGGCFSLPPTAKPIQAVSVYGATTGDKITARRW